MRDVFVCQICKEPISNFVDIERLEHDIKGWLPENISIEYENFNKWFLKIFNYQNDSDLHHHMILERRGRSSVCLYCYVNEIYQWLFTKNKAIAKRFRKIFSFGMKKTEFKEIIKAHAQPISEVENMDEEFGICDECGEYSDSLGLVNGRWICVICKH